MNDNKYKFADFLYSKRKSMSLTQEELGKQLGVTNKAVSKWETGETMPDISLLVKLANILNVSVDELLTQEEKKEEIIIKNNKFVLPVIILLSISLFCSLLFITVTKVNVSIEENKEITLNLDNYHNYIELNTYKTEITTNNLKITSSLRTTDYSINNFYIKLNYTVYCYYNDGVESLVIYSNQLTELTLENKETILTINHTKDISNPNQVSKIIVSYKIEEVSGVL